MAIPGFYTVTASSSLHMRATPSTSGSSIKALPYNTKVYVTEEKNGWAFCYNLNSQGQQDEEQPSGWCFMTYLKPSETVNLDTVKEPPAPVVEEDPLGPMGPPVPTESGDAVLPYLNFDLLSDYAETNDAYTIRSVMSIIGLPYQFLPTADRPLTIDPSGKDSQGVKSYGGAALGRKYANKIISRMPLLLMQPGRPIFLKKYNEKEKKNVLEAVFNVFSNTGENESLIDSVTDREGRYYGFEPDWRAYYDFVNPLCRIASRYLGVHYEKYNGVNIESVHWGEIVKKNTENFRQIPLYGAVPFYINSDTSWSDSVGNDTTQSQLAGAVNGISDMGRELNFLLGYGSTAIGKTFDFMNDDNLSTNINNVNNMIETILGGNKLGNFAQNISTNLITVATGGKLIFPEIWSDSNYSRSFSFTLKFVSPDSDPLSIYLNIIVPIIFCLGFTAPHSVDNNPNGYTAPFLVRAIYKGAFNCDMGIITDMSISRGGSEQDWTREGLPTNVEVSFTIKDLYSALSITPMESNLESPFKNARTFNTINNTALMDWVANICGINIYEPDIIRNIKMWFVQNVKNSITDAVLYRFWDGLGQRLQRVTSNIMLGGR